VLPEDLRDELARPIGKIVSAWALSKHIKGSPRIISVGDVVTITLLQMKMEPDVAVFDYKTQRAEDYKAKERIGKMSGRLVKVENPPGKITKALWKAVKEAVNAKDRVKVEVSGEVIDQGVFRLIRHDPQHVRQRRHLGRPSRRVTAGDDDLRRRVEARDPSDGLPHALIGRRRDGAAVDDDEIGTLGRVGAQAAGEQFLLDLEGVSLVDAAAEGDDGVFHRTLSVLGAWCLVLGAWLGVGAWCLVRVTLSALPAVMPSALPAVTPSALTAITLRGVPAATLH